MAFCDFFKREDILRCKNVCEAFVKEIYSENPFNAGPA